MEEKQKGRKQGKWLFFVKSWICRWVDQQYGTFSAFQLSWDSMPDVRAKASGESAKMAPRSTPCAHMSHRNKTDRRQSRWDRLWLLFTSLCDDYGSLLWQVYFRTHACAIKVNNGIMIHDVLAQVMWYSYTRIIQLVLSLSRQQRLRLMISGVKWSELFLFEYPCEWLSDLGRLSTAWLINSTPRGLFCAQTCISS